MRRTATSAELSELTPPPSSGSHALAWLRRVMGGCSRVRTSGARRWARVAPRDHWARAVVGLFDDATLRRHAGSLRSSRFQQAGDASRVRRRCRGARRSRREHGAVTAGAGSVRRFHSHRASQAGLPQGKEDTAPRATAATRGPIHTTRLRASKTGKMHQAGIDSSWPRTTSGDGSSSLGTDGEGAQRA